MTKKEANLSLDMRHFPEEIIVMMDKADYCLHCGAKLKYLDKEKRRNRGYCSLECYYKRPPKLAYAVQEWGKPPKELLLEVLNGRTTEAAAGMLGVNKQQLYRYIEKYNIKKKVIWE